MAERECEPIYRRSVLLGGGVILTSALTGCSQDGTGGTGTNEPTPDTETRATSTTEETPDTGVSSTPTTTSTDAMSLVETVRSEGYFTANNAGTRTDPVFEHLYRSKNSLRLETDVGGIVAARPHDQGVEISVDLTDEDQFAGCSVYFGSWQLQDITEIDFAMTGDEMRLIVQLNLNGDRDFLDWESVEGDREQFQGFAGDDRAISTYLTDGPVTLDDKIFAIPPGGAREPASGLSITDFQEIGNISVWIGAGVDHQDLGLPDSRQAVITDFSVTTT